MHQHPHVPEESTLQTASLELGTCCLGGLGVSRQIQFSLALGNSSAIRVSISMFANSRKDQTASR